jgi:hypothetical protein
MDASPAQWLKAGQTLKTWGILTIVVGCYQDPEVSLVSTHTHRWRKALMQLMQSRLGVDVLSRSKTELVLFRNVTRTNKGRTNDRGRNPDLRNRVASATAELLPPQKLSQFLQHDAARGKRKRLRTWPAEPCELHVSSLAAVFPHPPHRASSTSFEAPLLLEFMVFS